MARSTLTLALSQWEREAAAKTLRVRDITKFLVSTIIYTKPNNYYCLRYGFTDSKKRNPIFQQTYQA